MGIKKKVVQPKPVQQTTAMVVVDDRVYTKPRHDAGKLKVTRKDNTIDLFTSNEPNANAIVPIPVGENPEQTNVLTHADIYRSIAKIGVYSRRYLGLLLIGEAMANVGKKSKVEYDKLRKLGAKVCIRVVVMVVTPSQSLR